MAKIRKFITINKYPEAEQAACSVVKNIFENAPILGIDLDGTIDEAPDFFKMLSNVWPGLVYIITCRNDQEKAEKDTAKHGVYFDRVVMVSRLEDKAEVIRRLGVNVYIDDIDECLADIDPAVAVMKFRNPGNFNFDNKKWIYSERTGEKI